MLIGRIAVAVVAGVSALLAVTSASAVPNAANVQISILVGTGSIATQPPTIPNGGPRTSPPLDFTRASRSATPGPTSQQSRHSSLPTGLRWGADGPDPSEDCTEAVTTVCQAALGSSPTSTTPPQESAWGWNVVADAPGSYTVKAQIVESSTSDPDAADNSTTVTVVVTQPPPPPPPPPPAKATASGVKLSPAKPKAGSLVSATVRVTAGGTPIRPTGVACTGSLAGAGQGHPEGCLGDCVLPLALRNPRRKDPPWNDVVQRPRDEVHEVLRREARPELGAGRLAEPVISETSGGDRAG